MKAMSNKQQTAVQYLEEQLKMILPMNQFNDVVVQDAFNLAKELFKQQIIDAKMPKNLFGQIDQQEAINEAEQYFNDKFKSNGK